MDEATRAGSPPVDGEAERSPEEIRTDIERTRSELGDTVSAVADKADVKGRAKEKAGEVRERAGGQAPDVVKRNPLALAAAGTFVAGFLLGRLTGRR